MSNKKRPIIGLLVCGKFSDEMHASVGTYQDLYIKLLGTESFDYRSFQVNEGELPTIDDADAWLISGSRHGAYEEHDWIPPLENHIRAAYAAKQPIIGICFGHQILAQALGGRVEKFDGGWEMGQVKYELEGPFENVVQDNANLLAFHQDQVVELPETAKVVGRTANCQYAAIQYGSHALSIQPHPEFDDTLVTGLLDERGHLLPSESVGKARTSLGSELHNSSVAEVLRNFVLKGLE